MDVVKLSAGRAEVALLPALGGSIGCYRWATGDGYFDWLRAHPPSSVSESSAEKNPLQPTDTACFPLVPYSNRIRRGRFVFQGRSIVLPLNFGGSVHSIHGAGWQAPWEIVEVGDDRAILRYRHQADAWPFQYRAEQKFSLIEERLEIMLTLVNEDKRAMPAGIGFHPYFPRRRNTRLTAETGKVWMTDDEVMPTTLEQPPERWRLAKGVLVDGLDIDTLFTEWRGMAVVAWPDHDARLIVTATAPLDKLVVFSRPGADFFCVEPVSHITDAFNLANAGTADTGMRVLQPGQVLEGTVIFSPTLAAT